MKVDHFSSVPVAAVVTVIQTLFLGSLVYYDGKTRDPGNDIFVIWVGIPTYIAGLSCI